jgi:hypothetical protein
LAGIIAGQIIAMFIVMQIRLLKNRTGPKIVPIVVTFGGGMTEQGSEPREVLPPLTKEWMATRLDPGDHHL